MIQLWLSLQPAAGSAAAAVPAFDGAGPDLAATLRQAAAAGRARLVGKAGGKADLHLADTPEGALARLTLTSAEPERLPELTQRIGDDLPLVTAPVPRHLPWSVADLPANSSAFAALVGLVRALHDRVVPVAPEGASAPLPDAAPPPSPLPWIHGGPGGRRAGLRLQGGTWLLIEETAPAEARIPLDPPRAAEIVVLSGQDRAALTAELDRAAELPPELALDRIAAAQAARPALGERLALVAASRAELTRQMDTARKLLAKATDRFSHPAGIFYASAPKASEPPKRVALLFPGQGAQYAGMLGAAVRGLPGLGAWFDLLDRTHPVELPFLPSRLMLRKWPADSAETRALHSLAGGGVASLIGALAMTELLETLGLRPGAMIGHSNGENAALIASGVLRTTTRKGLFSTLMYMSGLFSTSDRSSQPHAGKCFALALPSDFDEAGFEAMLGPDVYLTMDNCPQQKVIWGREPAMGKVVAQLKEKGILAVPLPIEQPYHTPVFASIAEQFSADYGMLDLGPARVPLYSGFSGRPFPDNRAGIVATASGQWTAPVRFGQAIRQMHDDGMRVFIDVGPGGRLAGFVRDTLGNRPHLALAMDQESRPDASTPLRAIAQLFVLGALPDLARLYPGAVRATPEATPPAKPKPDQGAAAVSLPAVAPAPVPAASAAQRAGIARAHQQLMQDFLASETRLFAALAGRLRGEHAPLPRAEATPVTDPASQVTLEPYGLVRCMVEGEAWQAWLRLTPDRQSFLQDHAFGRHRSRREAAPAGLPVVPLFMSVEIAAAAACQRSGPGWRVTAIRNLRGHRWLAADTGRIDARVTVRPGPASQSGALSWHVRIDDCSEEGAPPQPAFEGEVVLEPGYPPPPEPLAGPTALPRTLRDDGAPLPTAADFAGKLFHGPSFRAMEEVLHIDQDGIEIALRAPGDNRLFAPGLASAAARPVPGPLLDSAGQILALHEKTISRHYFGLFPYSADLISFHAPPPAPGTPLRVVTRQAAEGGEMAGSLDFLGSDGTVMARIEGLRMVFINWSRRWERVFFPSQSAQPLGEVIYRGSDVAAVLVADFEPGFLDSSHKIWLRTLAATTLQESEQAEFRALPRVGARQREWLLGRIAVKEAALELLGGGGSDGPGLDAADITILAAAGLSPGFAAPGAPGEDGPGPASISHTAGYAAGATARSGLRVGIDIEPRAAGTTRLLDSRLAFLPEESAIVENLGQAAVWCAKEAVAKAIGTGLMGAPTRFSASAGASDANSLRITVMGESVEVRLLDHPDCYVALCTMEAEQASRLASRLAVSVAAR